MKEKYELIGYGDSAYRIRKYKKQELPYFNERKKDKHG